MENPSVESIYKYGTSSAAFFLLTDATAFLHASSLDKECVSVAELGNGSMQNGLRRIVSYFAAESASNLRLGRIQGGLVGVIGTAAVAGGIAFIYHEAQKKQLETEGKIILNTLQKSANKNTVIVEETPSDDVTEESDTDNNTPSEK